MISRVLAPEFQLKGEELQGIGALSWLNHGPDRMKGVKEPLEICEVGARAFLGEAGVDSGADPVGKSKSRPGMLRSFRRAQAIVVSTPHQERAYRWRGMRIVCSLKNKSAVMTSNHGDDHESKRYPKSN